MPSKWNAIYEELGLRALVNSPRDTKILCLQRLVRLFAYGSSTLVLPLLLTGLGHSAEKLGLFMTMTLLGDVVISLFLTMFADKIGRRRMLAFGSLLMTASGVVFALFSQYWILVLASIFGVISPSGNEIGPFRAVEESAISQLVESNDRSSLLAWYNMAGTAGAALGSVTLGWVVFTLQHKYAWDAIASYRLVFWVYAALGLVKFGQSIILTSKCEVDFAKRQNRAKPEQGLPLLGEGEQSEDVPPQLQPTPPKSSPLRAYLPEMSTHTINLLFRLCLLFGLDSLGSGIASTAWLVYFFTTKFGVDEGYLGSLFFITNVVAALSNLVAASIARRIGPIKTMIFTHLPASVLLMLLPLPSNQLIAMAFLIVRSCMATMDAAPRQAFLAAAVQLEERTVVMGITNVTKTLSQAGGPIIAGFLGGIGKIGVAISIAGGLKASYDTLMMVFFLGYRTVEERAQDVVEPEETELDDAHSARTP